MTPSPDDGWDSSRRKEFEMPVEQRRRLVTSVPGPRSLELAARKQS